MKHNGPDSESEKNIQRTENEITATEDRIAFSAGQYSQTEREIEEK